MAFAAGGAQAETGANWLFLNSKGETKTGAELKATADGAIENKAGSLLTKVLGIETEILCHAMKLVGLFFEGNGSLTNGGKAKFTECLLVDLNGVPNLHCEPHSPGAPNGTIETNSLKGLIVLVGGVARVRIEAKEFETLALIELGEECPIGSLIPVRGKLYITDTQLSTHLVKHLITEDSTNTDLWVLNKTAEHKAVLDGSTEVSLADADTGLKFSGDPA
jgi:hypothetical protein